LYYLCTRMKLDR